MSLPILSGSKKRKNFFFDKFLCAAQIVNYSIYLVQSIFWVWHAWPIAAG